MKSLFHGTRQKSLLIKLSVAAFLALIIVLSPLFSSSHSPTSYVNGGLVNLGTSTSRTVAALAKPSAAITHIQATLVSQVAPPTCAKDSFNVSPAPLNLAAGQNGVQQLVDVQYYQVYGTTAAQVQSQIKQCSQIGQTDESFAATTNYTVNWQYGYNRDSASGLCVATDAAVGVHVSQVYPNWNYTAGADPAYAAKWRAFVSHLQTHETGHRDLDLQYASKIEQDLKNVQTADCQSFKQAADGVANADIAALDQANLTYDMQTKHGLTQGAIIPN